jgi:hypothetical protein
VSITWLGRDESVAGSAVTSRPASSLTAAGPGIDLIAAMVGQRAPLTARRAVTQSPTADLDEPDGDFELPGADLAGEELTVPVLPMGADEFRCDSCFLVHHRSRLVVDSSGRRLCRDCV